jgi:hypothetical protein
MPLYTYVVTYKGGSYVSQARHSNFRGWLDWTDIPPNALPGLSPKMKRELVQIAYRVDFVEVPNRRHVWQKTLKVRGEDFTVHAIQTEK